MSKKQKILVFTVIILLTNLQVLQITESAYSFTPSKRQENGYFWIWEELSNPPGDIDGEDVVFWGENIGPYHNYTELTDKLMMLNSNFPNLVDVFSIGKSWQDRELWCVKITNETITSAKTEFYIVGAHHARELITVENALYFIDNLIYNQINFANYSDLLANTEIYIIPMLNPDGVSIIHKFPEQRKNMNPIDDDEDGSLFDEEERMYFWDSELNTSYFVENDLDYDGDIAEDLPGGTDLNRNYPVFWDGFSSSTDKNSVTYRGETPFSELETQAIRDFMKGHSFNLAVSLHSGATAIVTPWCYNLSLPIDDKEEYNALLTDLKDITGFSLWNETGYNITGGWDDYCYSYYNILSFTLKTYQKPSNDSYFDYYNPSGTGILSNCELINEALIYLALEPRLTYNNSLPAVKVTNPSEINQVIQSYTIRWVATDPDNDQLTCNIMISEDGNNWHRIASGLSNAGAYFWDLSTFNNSGSYYLKVAVYDGTDWIHDTTEVKLNVKEEPKSQPIWIFWVSAVVIGVLALGYLTITARKSKRVSKIWGPEEL